MRTRNLSVPMFRHMQWCETPQVLLRVCISALGNEQFDTTELATGTAMCRRVACMMPPTRTRSCAMPSTKRAQNAQVATPARVLHVLTGCSGQRAADSSEVIISGSAPTKTVELRISRATAALAHDG